MLHKPVRERTCKPQQPTAHAFPPGPEKKGGTPPQEEALPTCSGNPVRGRTGKPQQRARPHPVPSHLGLGKEGETHTTLATLSGGAPANPSSAPAQSPRGTASPAMVLRMGVKMMDARIRNAPFAIVVSCSPYTCGAHSKPC